MKMRNVSKHHQCVARVIAKRNPAFKEKWPDIVYQSSCDAHLGIILGFYLGMITDHIEVQP